MARGTGGGSPDLALSRVGDGSRDVTSGSAGGHPRRDAAAGVTGEVRP
jgi:hypothetical protein